MPSTNDDLAKRIDDLFPSVRRDLETLVRIPSVSLSGHDTDVRRSAETTRDLLAAAGFENTQLLELGSAHPAVFGEIPAPDGAPTVLLYAHHDVQPPGPAELWTSDPFEPVERNGRLYGRGTSDDKAGIAVHLGAIRAHEGRPPVGVKVFIEGEEEVGSEHLPQYIETFHELLASDVIVIADSGNWQVGTPCLTTSLRGLVDLEVEVRTLEKGVHSGLFGGVVPDALTVLCRTLATLHNEDGSVAVPGLVGGEAEPLPITDDDVKAIAGCHPELELMGDGHLTSRMWTQPAISVLAMDAPPLDQAINQLLPSARAKVSMRLAPGQDPAAAMDALASHLEANVPWGAQVTIERGSSGDAMSLETDGPAYDAFRDAFRQAWGVEPAEIGVGGSIPFVAAFQEAYPEASILLTGVGDSTSRQHGPDESQDLEELRRGMLAEAIALQLLAEA